MGWLSDRRKVAFSVGYSGHGVGPAHLAAKILRDMLLDRDSESRLLPMATKRPVPLPPRPVKGLFLDVSQARFATSDDGKGHRGPMVRLAVRVLSTAESLE